MTEQEKWDRYCGAINYCIRQGILIDFKDSAGGNVRNIRAKWDYLLSSNHKEAIITLKPKKYKPLELYRLILNSIGKPMWREENAE